MIYSQAIAPDRQLLSNAQIIETIQSGLDDKFRNQRVLVLIPDHTRSLPLPFLFRALIEILRDTKQLDFMVALGTHSRLSEESINRLVGITLGALAHSTHLRGSGRLENGIEKPNMKVTLAGKISAPDCSRLNLGYLDPTKIDLGEWKNRESQGILFVARAGETMYRVRTKGA